MTKQEEIGFSNELKFTRLVAKVVKDNLNKSFIEIGHLVIEELHSQGVVKRVEGKWISAGSRVNHIEVHTVDGADKYVAVEPLIKEKE